MHSSEFHVPVEIPTHHQDYPAGFLCSDDIQLSVALKLSLNRNMTDINTALANPMDGLEHKEIVKTDSIHR